MENATKALLIAAAILIAIVLISLGVYVLNIGQNAMAGADMTAQQVATFNAQFEAYCGNNVMGSKVKALQTAVDNNNRADEDKTINLTLPEGGISTGKAYTVEATDHTNAGLISEITVTEKN